MRVTWFARPCAMAVARSCSTVAATVAPSIFPDSAPEVGFPRFEVQPPYRPSLPPHIVYENIRSETSRRKPFIACYCLT